MSSETMRRLGANVVAMHRLALGSDASIEEMLTAAGGEFDPNLKRVVLHLQTGASGNWALDKASSTSTLEIPDGWWPFDIDGIKRVRASGSGYVGLYQIV
jgi:hypothetical protein